MSCSGWPNSEEDNKAVEFLHRVKALFHASLWLMFSFSKDFPLRSVDMKSLLSLNPVVVEMTSSSQPQTNFAVHFCKELDNLGDKDSFICSPISVETVLALVALGSTNDTRTELLTTLGIPDDNVLRSTFSSLTKTLDIGSFSFFYPLSFIKSKFLKREVTLKFANKIYVKKGRALKSDLKRDAVNVFGSSLEQIDFNQSSVAANIINDWVARQTNDIIKEIVTPEMLNNDTGLVLVNAIYFHGLWEIPFKPEDTFTGDFHVNNNDKVEIRMMKLEGEKFNYMYSPQLKAKILEMIYQGGEASMVIILPDEIEGLSSVMERLSAGYDLIADINSLAKTLFSRVNIPKFKTETEIDLMNLLPKMGINKIFDPNDSDINMLTSNERLYVSKAIQKAYILVDEEGTVAAAATANTVMLCCAMIWKGETFIADRPYLYLLMARKIPIFYGIFRGDDRYSRQEIEKIDKELSEFNALIKQHTAERKARNELNVKDECSETTST